MVCGDILNLPQHLSAFKCARTSQANNLIARTMATLARNENSEIIFVEEIPSAIETFALADIHP